MTSDRYDQFVKDLNEERLAALTRISRRLDALIAQLRAGLERIPTLPEPARSEELAAWRQLRKQAARYRWYLEVQREALGLRHHHRLDEFYAIPPSPAE